MSFQPDRRSFMLGGSLLLAGCATSSLTQTSAPGPGTGAWATSSPEAKGLSSAALKAAAAQLGAPGERQGLVVVRGGELVFEQYWANDYARATPDWQNVSFSSGKSWGSTMVGRAQYQGYLDINDLASKYVPAETTGFNPATTIKHLLTMSSGGTLNTKPSSVPPKRLDDPTPPGAGVEYEWHDAPEDGKPEGYGTTIQPGTQFIYDGAPADHLADIVSAATGQTSLKYMTDEVIKKLGCRHTGYQPEGVDSNGNVRIGGSMLISCRDMARLGQLYLNGGRWGRKRLISEDYVRQATSPSATREGYGYLWWLNADDSIAKAPKSMFFAAGALGQYCFVLPEQDMVISTMGFGRPGLSTDAAWDALAQILPA
ncbi:serine hydrolase domain-containing protein [Henriciella litoralis]|uniref:serine hydrolase domain-containing protein n=1 Tax=Henriciella litoralis TaxID=568102 RepID=UPI000A050D3E|nr:serine hydrolase domain-containing protein [Henriciella litoralis]